MVKVLVDLALLTVLAEHAAEHTLPPHPQNLGRHTGLGGTLALTSASVTSLGLGGIVGTNAGARVDSLGLDDDVAVLLEGANAAIKIRISVKPTSWSICPPRDWQSLRLGKPPVSQS